MTATALAPNSSLDERRWGWLPPMGSVGYYTLLVVVGMLVLGPLGGLAASYMNFSLGFYVNAQVMAGILGSIVTLGYGPSGRHGANYMQTMAASVAGMMAMSCLLQARVWMGLPPVPTWQLVAYMLCIGMLGAGVGMLYTPTLVERMKLTYPSGLAVANILRALTDPALLKRSVARLFGGIAAGISGGVAAAKVGVLGAIELSCSTFGAGLIVGARITIPAVTSGLLFWALTPTFVEMGWLKEGEPFRKIAFLIALGLILGATVIDISLILWQAVARWRGLDPAPSNTVTTGAGTETTGPAFRLPRLLAFVGFWALAVVLCGTQFFAIPLWMMLLALGLVAIFVMGNGISVGLTDSNPISSAFVLSVILFGLAGLTDPMVGLMAATVLLIATSIGCDMQQDRSTGWRLGSNRALQFRFQVGGILVGALLAVGIAELFMAAYPILRLDQTVMSAEQQPAQWASAMTYKFVGVLRGLSEPNPAQTAAIVLGVTVGLLIEVARKLLKSRARYQAFVAAGRVGFATDFCVDALVLPSPYAFSFGGFVNLPTSLWFGAGGVVSSLWNSLGSRRRTEGDLPSDMSTTSLIGGGLIAGDALAALGLGVMGLLALV
ncbi:putative oligopeptide transporter (OPT) family protein [Inhella inkyongensis]|uniref:Putative oligopeptide transporter (OPT) family protein n=1 Tax=Inhella inkyongensis TaxID=392593 RepID=A0A840S2I8_9BURK|nr:OPT/YSL family transporter [Inhella inkyongensis]MBB5202901.1 putative oligopeptide transporter (OPT) family protein [Inhella inkyongensis]